MVAELRQLLAAMRVSGWAAATLPCWPFCGHRPLIFADEGLTFVPGQHGFPVIRIMKRVLQKKSTEALCSNVLLLH